MDVSVGVVRLPQAAKGSKQMLKKKNECTHKILNY
jgi:hypothetical protein